MQFDKNNNYLFWHKNVALDQMPDFYENSDIFVHDLLSPILLFVEGKL